MERHERGCSTRGTQRQRAKRRGCAAGWRWVRRRLGLIALGAARSHARRHAISGTSCAAPVATAPTSAAGSAARAAATGGERASSHGRGGALARGGGPGRDQDRPAVRWSHPRSSCRCQGR